MTDAPEQPVGHTAGEWITTSDEHYVSPASDRSQIIAIVCEPGECGGVERGANARLIAAAPDLLEALQEIVSYAGGAQDALHDDYVMERVQAAITKATS